MKYLIVGSLCLIALLATGALMAGSASAAAWERCAEGTEKAAPTKYTSNQCSTAASELKGKWEWDEMENTEKISITGLTLTLKDEKTLLGKEAVRCTAGIEGEGVVGLGAMGEITAFKVKEAEKNCTSIEGPCEKGKIEEVTGADLPWQVYLSSNEGKLLTRLQASGSGEPGLKIKCKTIGGPKTDTCTVEGEANPEELNFENVSSGGVLSVQAVFGHTHKTKCTEGGAEAGEIQGAITLKAASGEGLKVGGTTGITVPYLVSFDAPGTVTTERLRNNTRAPQTLDTMSRVGANPAEFTGMETVASECAGIMPGQECKLTFGFLTGAIGTYTAEVIYTMQLRGTTTGISYLRGTR